VPNLIRVSQRLPEQALAPRLKHDRPLAFGQHHAPQRDHALAAHRVADDRERLKRHLALRNEVVGALDVALVDLGFRHEAVDVDRMAALDRDRVELLVLDLQVDALVDLVAPPLVVGIDRLPRLVVDQLLAEAVAGLLVDLPESDPLARRGRGVERDRAGDEGKLEIAFPVGAGRGHGNSYSTRTTPPYNTPDAVPVPLD